MGAEALQGMCAEVMSMSRRVPNCVCSSGLHSSRTNKMSIQNTFHPTDIAVEKYPFTVWEVTIISTAGESRARNELTVRGETRSSHLVLSVVICELYEPTALVSE